jgi:hypothetical protein
MVWNENKASLTTSNYVQENKLMSNYIYVDWDGLLQEFCPQISDKASHP